MSFVIDEADAEEIVEFTRLAALPAAHELEMSFLDCGIFAGRQADRFFQGRGGLAKIPQHLPGGRRDWRRWRSDWDGARWAGRRISTARSACPRRT